MQDTMRNCLLISKPRKVNNMEIRGGSDVTQQSRELLLQMVQQLQTENSALCRQAAHNGLFIEQLEAKLAKAKYVIPATKMIVNIIEYKQLQAKNKRMKKGLYKIRQSTEIMEARRFAEKALKEQK